VTEQRKGTYRYFVDRGDGMEVVNTRTEWTDKVTIFTSLRKSFSKFVIRHQACRLRRMISCTA
jgi:hypothetical protein